MVGCWRCTYPSIHFFVSRSRSVVWCVVWCVCGVLCVYMWCCVWCWWWWCVCVVSLWWCVCVLCGACVWCVVKIGTLSLSLALSPSSSLSLDEDTLKITVGCLLCGVVCVRVLWWCVCVVCGEDWHPLSLLLSLLPLLFPFRFPFLFLSYLYFSLFFFFFFFFSCSFSYSCSCSCSFSFSSLSLFSPPNTMERTDQPTRRPTSRHLNVIWRRASAQQSVLSPPLPSLLPSPPPLLKKKRGNFLLQEYFRRGIYFLLQFLN